MSAFCVKCGRDCDDTVNGLCPECFLGDREIVKLPHHVDLEVCANCGEYHRGESWVRRERDDAIEEAAMDALMAIPEANVYDVASESSEQDPRAFSVTLHVAAEINGVEAQGTATTIVRMKNTVCKKCSRQLGNYYEAIIQLRTGGRADMPAILKKEATERIVRSVEEQARTNRQLFITKMGDVVGGVDIYVSSIALGRNLAREAMEYYGAETKESASLAGVNAQGIEIYRVTYLVRLPDYHVGDVLRYQGAPWRLVHISKTGGRLTNLESFRTASVRKSELPDLRILVRFNDIQEATVVSKSDGEVQVLNPRNYATVDLKVPEGMVIGDTVLVAEVEDVLYLMP